MLEKFWQSLAVVLIACGLAPTGNAAIYISGHADIAAHFDAGALHIGLHAENDLNLVGGGTLPAGEYEASDIMIGVPGTGPFPGTGTPRPAGALWDFLGSPGELVWVLPQNSAADRPFLGLGTEELLPADGWLTPLTWTINSISTVSGDIADIAVWQSDPFGGLNVVASTRTPTGSGNSWTQNPLSHEHYNYGFNGEGIYDVTFGISGFNSTLSQTFNETATFRFVTGSALNPSAVPEPTTALALASTLTAVTAWRHRKNRRSKGVKAGATA